MLYKALNLFIVHFIIQIYTFFLYKLKLVKFNKKTLNLYIFFDIIVKE